MNGKCHFDVLHDKMGKGDAPNFLPCFIYHKDKIGLIILKIKYVPKLKIVWRGINM